MEKSLVVLYVPKTRRNLLSTNKFIQKGAILVANEKKMETKKDIQVITLPSKRETCGNMYCLKAKNIFEETINDMGTTKEDESENYTN